MINNEIFQTSDTKNIEMYNYYPNDRNKSEDIISLERKRNISDYLINLGIDAQRLVSRSIRETDTTTKNGDVIELRIRLTKKN